MFCPECGKKNEEAAIFCEECGARLIDDQYTAEEENAGGQQFYQQPGQQPYQQSGQQFYQQPGQQSYQQSRQQSYQQPGQQPRVRPKKKKSGAAKALIAEVILGVVFAAALGVMVSRQFSPEKVVENYWKAMKAGNWSTAYDYCEFPAGDHPFLSKQMFINAMEMNRESEEYSSCKVRKVQDSGDFAREYDSVGIPEDASYAVYEIVYTPKDSSEQRKEYIFAVSSEEKKFLIWDQWKVWAPECVPVNTFLSVPAGSKISIDNLQVPDKLLEESVEMGIQYVNVQPGYMFAGDHQVKIEKEDYLPYYMLADPAEYSPGRIDALLLDEEMQEEIAEQLADDLDKILQAAMEQKKFRSIEDCFTEESIRSEEAKSVYDELAECMNGENGYSQTILSIEISDIEVQCGGNNTDFRVCGTMKESALRSGYGWYSQDKIEEKERSFDVLATYKKEGDEWKLDNEPIRSDDIMWY